MRQQFLIPTIGLIALGVLFALQMQVKPASAALKCSRLVKTAGGEKIVNTCGSCRIVNIQRKRPGADAPINRTLTLAPRTTTDLSFRGPGQSRILADTPCSEAGADGSNTGAQPSPEGDGKRCILMQRTQKAGITGLALANTCAECRTAVVDRIDAGGQRRSQNVVIAGKSVIPLPALGAVQAGILHEKACK
ncbi:MAG: hypothetical protein ISR45_04500 [Rhodospirillales bacterium]|nr:hypothetical protein [Rhodospirillales bacterium]